MSDINTLKLIHSTRPKDLNKVKPELLKQIMNILIQLEDVGISLIAQNSFSGAYIVILKIFLLYNYYNLTRVFPTAGMGIASPPAEDVLTSPSWKNSPL